MNFEYTQVPSETKIDGDGLECRVGKADAYFAGGLRIKAKISELDDPSFGTQYYIVSLEISRKAHNREALEVWVEEIKTWTGPLTAFYKTVGNDWRGVVVLEGQALEALQCNASNRRNDLPVYKWDDAAHPRHAQ